MRRAILAGLAALLMGSLMPAAQARDRDDYRHYRSYGYPYGYYNISDRDWERIGRQAARMGINIARRVLRDRDYDDYYYLRPMPGYQYVYPSRSAYCGNYWYYTERLK
jgi:hypothetical protein